MIRPGLEVVAGKIAAGRLVAVPQVQPVERIRQECGGENSSRHSDGAAHDFLCRRPERCAGFLASPASWLRLRLRPASRRRRRDRFPRCEQPSGCSACPGLPRRSAGDAGRIVLARALGRDRCSLPPGRARGPWMRVFPLRDQLMPPPVPASLRPRPRRALR